MGDFRSCVAALSALELVLRIVLAQPDAILAQTDEDVRRYDCRGTAGAHQSRREPEVRFTPPDIWNRTRE
jgi:hypothetical protein